MLVHKVAQEEVDRRERQHDWADDGVGDPDRPNQQRLGIHHPQADLGRGVELGDVAGGACEEEEEGLGDDHVELEQLERHQPDSRQDDVRHEEGARAGERVGQLAKHARGRLAQVLEKRVGRHRHEREEGGKEEGDVVLLEERVLDPRLCLQTLED